MPPTGRRTPHGQDGFALIEILVSALVLAIVAGAVLSLLQATARSANDERRHSEAYALAQEDQARLRSMRLSSLNRLQQKSELTLDRTKFTVESTGVFVNNSTGNDSSCTTGETAADYVRVTSKVTWGGLGTRPPVVIQSIVSPSTGSLDPNHGILIVTTKNAAGFALPGVALSGTGTSTFGGSTDSTGCANFADLPWGNYTVTASGSDLVAKDGYPPQPESTSVIAGGTNTKALVYDHAATLPVQFEYRDGSSSVFKVAKLDSVYVFNSGMNPAHPYWTPTKAREASITATPIFPFISADAVYAGACSVNNPGAGPGLANVMLNPSETAPLLKLQVPALELTIKNGATPISGARITITDRNCQDGSSLLKRVYTSDANGHQNSSAAAPVTTPEFGLPWGSYDICASANYSSTNHRLFVNNVSVKSFSSSVALSLNLSSAEAESGSTKVCP
jgi:prepilin-type N-terminal cleavage/methylation domain-containing protein